MVTTFYNYFFHQTVTELSSLKSYVHMTEINDQDLILKIIEGDIQLYSDLVNRYKDLVYTLVIQMLKNNEEAEEVAQDSFLKAFKNLSKFKGDSKFSTWLYKITYNTCLDRLKKIKQNISTTELSNKAIFKLNDVDSVIEKMELQERNAVISNCLQMLPGEDSFLITLFYYEDLSLEEISKILSISISNAKVKLFRCRKKLADILREKLEPEIIERYERTRR